MAVIGVVMGSQSDWEVMRHAADLLARFGVAGLVAIAALVREPAEGTEIGLGDRPGLAGPRHAGPIGRGGLRPLTQRLDEGALLRRAEQPRIEGKAFETRFDRRPLRQISRPFG